MDATGIIVPSSPILSYIELTYQCNNHCVGCGNLPVSNRRERSLPVSEWQKIFHKLKPAVSYLCLTGGEPTLYPDFDKILDLIHTLRIPFSLFTNARWYNPEKTISLLRRSPFLKEIFVSLHGPDPESHDRFTGVKGSFEETGKNIRRCVSEGLPVVTDTLITAKNFDRIGDMIQLNQRLGAGCITFSRYITAQDDFLSPSREQLVAAIEAIGEHDRQVGVPVRTSVCVPQCFYPSGLFNGCLAGIISVTIGPSGDVRPCVMASLLCGNLLEKSLEDVWESEALKRWRSMVPGPCFHCVALSACRGGCRAAALMRGLEKDPLMTEPFEKDQPRARQEIVLSAEARPTKHYLARREDFGLILVSGLQVTPVTVEAMPILDACDGDTTLGEIYERFGQEGLNFVASLYQRGHIQLASGG